MQQYLPAFCALAGAVIGAASVAFVTWITQRQETKRRLLATLIECGFEEWKTHIEIADKRKSAKPIAPPWAYILVMTSYAPLLEHAGDFSDAEIRKKIRKIAGISNTIIKESKMACAPGDVDKTESPERSRGV